MSQIQQFKTAALNASASGDNTVVAAVTGRSIKVYKIWFVAAGTVSPKFRDGTTDLSAAAPMVANGSFTLYYDGSPHWVTSPGNAFVINLSSAVAITGQVYYLEG